MKSSGTKEGALRRMSLEELKKEEDISSWIDWWLLKHESLMAYCMEHRYDGSCVKGLPCGCIAENELKCFTFFYYDFENITSAIEEEKEIFSAIQAYKKGVKLYRNDANLLYNLFKDGEEIYGRLGLSPFCLEDNPYIYDIENPNDFNKSYPSISSFKINPNKITYFMQWYVHLRPLRQNEQIMYEFYRRSREEHKAEFNY